MSWAKLDDKFYLSPKFLRLNPRALSLWTYGLAHAAGLELDGFIPRAEVPILAARFGCSRPARAFDLAAELVARGLWYEVPSGFKVARIRSARHPDGELFRAEGGPAGYQIHDYLDANPAAARLLDGRRAAAARQLDWRRSVTERQRRVQEKQEDEARRNAVTNASPDPTRPDPTRKREKPFSLSLRSNNGNGNDHDHGDRAPMDPAEGEALRAEAMQKVRQILGGEAT